MLRQVFLSVVFITALKSWAKEQEYLSGRRRRRQRFGGGCMAGRCRTTAVAPCSGEGGAGPWQSWSLAELVLVGVGPWKTVRVRGFKMCRRRPLHRRRAGRASRSSCTRTRTQRSIEAGCWKAGGSSERRPVVERPALPRPRCPNRWERGPTSRSRGGPMTRLTDTPAIGMGAREGVRGRGG